ncbi:MAG TPA: hypothetical protein DCE44_21380, partial [Verrucomicrobiales bacterium]|nr:hypothetical protein [Verrucomicrobiales bacterium]
MITVRPMKNAETAKKYYTEHLARSEYYSQGCQSSVQWFGKGCARLGLEPGMEVSQEAFECLCDNLHPLTGEKLTVRHRSQDRRVCYDFVANAVKGVSLMVEFGGDHRLVELHERSSCVAMTEAESVAATRIRKGGADGERRTGEIVAARVTHHTSRALDPGLHTHFVVFNATWDSVENRWKALQTREMFDRINLFTQIYRSEMAAGLRKLGYQLRPTAHGFEIDGIPEELLERFSKRRKAILDAEKIVSGKIGKPLSNNARATLAQTTRDWKDLNQSPEEIRQYQLSQITAEELATLRSLVPKTNSSSAPAISQALSQAVEAPAVSAADAVSYARDHLFERKSVVPLYAFQQTAMAYSHGALKMEAIDEELARRSEFVEFEESLTTHEMIRREQEMLGLVNSGIGQSGPINPNVRTEVPLNREQKNALRSVMNSPDWVIGIRGVAGSGKTELLRSIAEGVSQVNRKAVVLAPTTAACDSLRQRGISWAATMQSFLALPEFQQQSRGAVLMVDEAGLISVGDMLQMLRVARTQNCRVALCGDTRQHTSVEAGDALRLLEERSAMQSADLLQNNRQKSHAYREAIDAFAAGNGILGLSRLDAIGALHEENDEASHSLAAGYLSSVTRGKSALIVSPTWREIQSITEDVRGALKEHNKLGQEDTLVENHTSLNWTRAQKRDLRNYRRGLVLGFHRSTAEIARGECLRVLETADQAMIAKKADGTQVKLTRKQADCFDVLESGKLPVATGEKLLLKGNLKTHGLINGKCVEVRAIRADGTLDLVGGRTIPPEFRTFTHGYCVTSMAAQGRTADHVYVSVRADSLAAANLNQFYV